MSASFSHTALGGALRRLLRRLSAGAPWAVSGRAGCPAPKPGASRGSGPLHETEEQALADLGLSRRFPFPAEND